MIGKKVKVFQKPYTDEDLEGVGVIKKVGSQNKLTELYDCMVGFPCSDGFDENVFRLIHERNIIP